MTFTDIKEIYEYFKTIEQDWWGNFTKQDILDFLSWLENTEDMKAISWTRLQPIPFELDEFYDDFKKFHGYWEEEEEENEGEDFDINAWHDELMRDYYRALL